MKGTLEEITVSAGLIADDLAKFTLLIKKLIEAREIGGAEAMPDETIRAILLGSAGKVQRSVEQLLRRVNVYGIDLGAAYRSARAAQEEDQPEPSEPKQKPVKSPRKAEDGKPVPAAVNGGKK